MFQCDPEKGLSLENVEKYRSHYGHNKLPEPPKPSIAGYVYTLINRMLWTQLTDFMVLILIIASIVQGVLDDIKSSVVLILVVLINVIIGFSQEYSANKGN